MADSQVNGAAEALYARIQSDADVREFVENRTAETLHLDFKGEPQSGTLRGVLGRALSGFANSDGGVLVFGVDARGDKLEPRPIDNLPTFERQVNELLSRAVAFPVAGVEVKRVPANASQGYLVVLIPRSDMAPHQAVDSKQYHRRHGESFPAMEHYEIANAFGRRPHPILVVHHNCRLQPEKSDGGHKHVYRMTFSIENRGRAMALHYGFDVVLRRIASTESNIKGHRQERKAERFSVRNEDGRPLFPGEVVLLEDYLEYVVNHDVYDSVPPAEIVMEVVAYADSTPAQTQQISFQDIHQF